MKEPEWHWTLKSRSWDFSLRKDMMKVARAAAGSGGFLQFGRATWLLFLLKGTNVLCKQVRLWSASSCFRQTIGVFARARGRENEKKKKKGCPAHHHGCSVTDVWPRWMLLRGCCSCEANLRPDPQTSVFRPWTDFQIFEAEESWQEAVRMNPKRHSPSPAPPCSTGFCLFCSAPVCSSFPCSPDFLVSRRPESAGFTSIAFAPCF